MSCTNLDSPSSRHTNYTSEVAANPLVDSYPPTEAHSPCVRIDNSSHVVRTGAPPPMRCRVAKRFLLRLSTLLTLALAALLLSIFAICMGMASTMVHEPLKTLAAVHETQLKTVSSQLNIFATLLTTIAATFSSLSDACTKSKSTLSSICSILDNYDTNLVVRSVAVQYVTHRRFYSCIRNAHSSHNPRQLFGTRSVNDIVDAYYYIDPVTYNFTNPPKVWQYVLPQYKNVTTYLQERFGSLPMYDMYYDFLEDKIPTYPMELSWRRHTLAKDIIAFTYPLPDYITDSAEEAAYSTTRGEASIEVRAFSNSLLRTSVVSPQSGVRVLMFDPTTLNTTDPIALYNNWGQPTSNSTTIPAAVLNNSTIVYMHISNVTDPLMREALKHIDVPKLQHPNYSATVSFSFKAAPAVVTACRGVSKNGMEVGLILVTPMYEQTGPLHAHYIIALVVLLVVMLALIVLFWWFTDRMLSRPLAHVAKALTNAATLGERERLPSAGHLTFTEVTQVMDTYSKAMRVLRHLDTFIPEEARRILMAEVDADAEIAGATGADAATQTAREDSILSIVYITPRCRDGAAAPVPLPQRFDAGDIERAMEEHARHVRSSQTGAFPTNQALVAFLKVLYAQSASFGGLITSMTPERCVVYFEAANGAYTRGQPESQEVQEKAISAVQFALAVSQALESLRPTLHIPLTTIFVDTTHVTHGLWHSTAHSKGLPWLSADRDVSLDIGYIPPMIGLDVAMTEQTAVLVRDAVRQLPCEIITVGRNLSTSYQVALYEPLAGSVTCVPWRHYAHHYTNAFMHMTQGKYREALDEFDEASHLKRIYASAVEDPQRSSTEAREGNPLQPRQGTCEWVPSVQVERLSNVCAARVMMNNHHPYYREPFSQRFLHLLHMPLVSREVPRHRQREEVEAEEVDRQAAVAAAASGKVLRWRSSPPALELARGTQVNTQKEASCSLVAKAQGEPLPLWKVRLACPVLPSDCVVLTMTSRIHDSLGTTWFIAKPATAIFSSTAIYCHCLSATGTTAFAFFYPFIDRITVPCETRAGMVTPSMGLTEKPKTKEQLDAGSHLFLQDQKCEHIMNLLGFSNDEEGGVVEILEYYPGGTLREMMDRYTCVLPIPTVTHYIASVLLALHYLHGRGIVHGDVRPENVHVSTEAHCKLRGFFANRVLAQRILLLHESCYVCPKVAGGAAATTASDVYSAGLVLLEMLRGAPPWKWAAGTQGRTVGDLQELLDDSHAFRAALASGAVVVAADAADIPCDPGPLLRDLLDRCLHSDLKQRTTAAEVVAAVGSVFTEQTD